MTDNDKSESVGLDAKALNKYSRQIAAFGAETTAKLTKMKVLVYGLRGIGIETAKNLSLQGVGGITVVDQQATFPQDVGQNFFLTDEDAAAGTPRVEAVTPRLRELNPMCDVKMASALTDELIKAHTALVITDKSVPLSELVRLDELCRSNGVSFFYAFTGGACVSIFVDHGEKHIVNDPDGERPVQKIITDISPVDKDTYIIRYETPEGQPVIAVDSGAYEIGDVTGLDGINGSIVEVSHPYSDPVKTVRVVIPGLSANPYIAGGLLTEKKLPKPYPMLSLREKIKNPGSPFSGDMVMTDLSTFSEQQQHVALIATLSEAQNGDFPAPNSAEDAERVISRAKSLIAAKDVDLDIEVDDSFVRKFALHAALELQPLSAFVGGVLAQEVVKSTGKFTPIPGWMHFHALEALPSPDSAPADTSPRQSRYDELAAIYGWSFVEKLSNLKYFMVGCGALGCEFLKNFALNGICCGPDGRLTVTDADRIELSNLSRQFLFREHNVGQPKSRAACAMAQRMNTGLKVNAMELFVGPSTEDTFSDRFWMELDGVCNALDNMEARKYVDTQCVRYEKSLLESGTMGTGGNIDTICPFKTRTYRDGGNAAEGGQIPMCTLRNFPHLTDHCIEWARDQFELLFAKLPKAASKYLTDPDGVEDKLRSDGELSQAIFEARCTLSMLKAGGNPTVGTAAQLAFDLFHMLFRDKIMDLQAAFPPDSRMIEKGVDKGPFWSEKKRYPTAAEFNPADESHWNFMASTTCLFGVILGIFPSKTEGDDDWLKDFRGPEWVSSLVPSLSIPPYINSPISSDANPEEAKGDDSAASKAAVLEGVLSELRAVAADGITLPPMEPADFEKDDDLNFHIAFVTSASNLRCDNYSIKRTDFHACKVIAGKIIAAIATTTAAVCGLVILELFKLLLGKDTEALMNRQIGLASNAYPSFTQEPPIKFNTYTERTEPEDLPAEAYDEKGVVKDEFVEKKVMRAYPENHSVWDKIVCDGSLTLDGFASILTSQHNLNMTKWDMVVGFKDHKPVSTPIYPPKPLFDPSLLPSLDVTMPQATQAIMRNPSAKPTQLYINTWKECKAVGSLAPAEAVVALNSGADVIKGSTTLREILDNVERLADTYVSEKKIDQKNISFISQRLFWVIPGSEAPTCKIASTGEEVAALAAFKIAL